MKTAVHLARAGRTVDRHLGDRAGTVARELAEAQERTDLMPGQASFAGAVRAACSNRLTIRSAAAGDSGYANAPGRRMMLAPAWRAMSSIAAAAARAACAAKATIA